MPIATTTALALGLGASAAGSTASSIIGANATGNAVNAQVNAANYAADLTLQSDREARQLQQEAMYNAYATQLPWLQTGTAANYELSRLMGLPVPQKQQYTPTTELPYTALGQDQRDQTRADTTELQDIRDQISQIENEIDRTSGFGRLGARLQYRDQLETLRQREQDLSSQLGVDSTVDSNNWLGNIQSKINTQPANTDFLTGFINPSMLDIKQNTSDITRLMNGENNNIDMYTGGTPNFNENVGPDLPLEQQSDGSYAYVPGATGEFMAPMNQIMSDWQTDPGYQFMIDEASRAVERSAAARGSLVSGRTLQELERLRLGYASQEYSNIYARRAADINDRYNRLANQAGMGQVTSQSVGTAAQQYANNMSNLAINTGQTLGNISQNAAEARASGYMANANMWNNTISNLSQLPLNYYMMSQIFNK